MSSTLVEGLRGCTNISRPLEPGVQRVPFEVHRPSDSAAEIGSVNARGCGSGGLTYPEVDRGPHLPPVLDRRAGLLQVLPGASVTGILYCGYCGLSHT